MEKVWIIFFLSPSLSNQTHSFFFFLTPFFIVLYQIRASNEDGKSKSSSSSSKWSYPHYGLTFSFDPFCLQSTTPRSPMWPLTFSPFLFSFSFLSLTRTSVITFFHSSSLFHYFLSSPFYQQRTNNTTTLGSFSFRGPLRPRSAGHPQLDTPFFHPRSINQTINQPHRKEKWYKPVQVIKELMATRPRWSAKRKDSLDVSGQ